MGKQAKKTIELPDVTEFLKLARRIIREMDLLEGVEGTEIYQELTKEAALKMGTKALDFANKRSKGEEQDERTL